VRDSWGKIFFLRRGAAIKMMATMRITAPIGTTITTTKNCHPVNPMSKKEKEKEEEKERRRRRK